MPRSGTTLVEQIISSHPQVFGAGELTLIMNIEKKIAGKIESESTCPECMLLISDSLALEFSGDYLNDLRRYSEVATRISDKMPDNFRRIGFIKTLFPKARIIHCQRNALDTCTSIFLNYFAKGNNYSFDLIDIGQFYLDYKRLMEHWHNLFPTEIFNVENEALVLDQEKISREIIEYLGLEWDENCLDFYKNERIVQTASNLQVRDPINDNSINKWKRYEKHLGPLISILGD